MLQSSNRVAIFQSSLVGGGRLRVVISIIKVLNENGVVPDVFASKIGLTSQQIQAKYGQAIRATYHKIPHIPWLPLAFSTVLFNALMNVYAASYDVWINSNNSLIFMPKRKNVLTYMHFPQKARVVAESTNLHHPETTVPFWSKAGIKQALLRIVYRLSIPRPNHTILCNSEFTRDSLAGVYSLAALPAVVYPPVQVTKFKSDNRNRSLAVTTIGRFDPDKRQLEQIMLAEKSPELEFHIIGFAGNQKYYQRCEDYVRQHNLTNVHLHPNAAFTQMIEILQTSKFFLHTLVNEPFGITAVQAIAAGCIPIVHDSGGQREVVTMPELRYRDLDEVPAILRKMDALDVKDVDVLVRNLQNHVMDNFDERVFVRKMQQIIAEFCM